MASASGASTLYSTAWMYSLCLLLPPLLLQCSLSQASSLTRSLLDTSARRPLKLRLPRGHVGAAEQMPYNNDGSSSNPLQGGLADLTSEELKQKVKKKLTISYHGGPVLGTKSPFTVYIIYYGHWNTPRGRAKQRLYDRFIRSLSADSGAKGAGGVPSLRDYWKTMTQFYQVGKGGRRAYVSKLVRVRRVYDFGSQGKRWSDQGGATWAVVRCSIARGHLPWDPNGLYLVVTSPGVQPGGSACSSACGWHTNWPLWGRNIAYAFVADADQCPDACGTFPSASPGRSPGTDGTISTIMHEIAEAVSNPDTQSGWFSDDKDLGDQDEIGDLCDSFQGRMKTSGHGRNKYNVLGIGNVPFSIGGVFSRVHQSCRVSG